MIKQHELVGWVNINGTIVKAAEACISVFDRGFLFGDSVYEVVRTYNGVPFKFEDHYRRLLRSARHLGMEDVLITIPVEAEMLHTLHHADYPESYIRLIVTRGISKIGLQTDLASAPNFIIILQPLAPVPEEHYQDGIHMAVVSVVRNPIKSLDPNVKTGNYLNNLLAMREAQLNGAQEAVMLNFEGQVTEATTSNVFFVYDGVLVTPPIEVGILEGVTRKFICELAEKYNLNLQVRNVSVTDIPYAQECFITGTIKEIVPVTMINHKPVGDGKPGPITKHLSNTFRRAVCQPVHYPDT